MSRLSDGIRRWTGRSRRVEDIGCRHAQPASAFSAYAGSERDGMTDFGKGTSLKKRWDGHLELTFTKTHYTGTIEGVDIFYAGHFISHANLYPSVTGVGGDVTLSIALALEPDV